MRRGAARSDHRDRQGVLGNDPAEEIEQRRRVGRGLQEIRVRRVLQRQDPGSESERPINLFETGALVEPSGPEGSGQQIAAGCAAGDLKKGHGTPGEVGRAPEDFASEPGLSRKPQVQQSPACSRALHTHPSADAEERDLTKDRRRLSRMR